MAKGKRKAVVERRVRQAMQDNTLGVHLDRLPRVNGTSAAATAGAAGGRLVLPAGSRLARALHPFNEVLYGSNWQARWRQCRTATALTGLRCQVDHGFSVSGTGG